MRWLLLVVGLMTVSIAAWAQQDCETSDNDCNEKFAGGITIGIDDEASPVLGGFGYALGDPEDNYQGEVQFWGEFSMGREPLLEGGASLGVGSTFYFHMNESYLWQDQEHSISAMRMGLGKVFMVNDKDQPRGSFAVSVDWMNLNSDGYGDDADFDHIQNHLGLGLEALFMGKGGIFTAQCFLSDVQLCVATYARTLMSWMAVRVKGQFSSGESSFYEPILGKRVQLGVVVDPRGAVRLLAKVIQGATD